MSAEIRALFLGLAVLLFVLAAYDEFRSTPNRPRSLGLVAAGLAAATFPAFWDALDVALD
jgi:hypothetical protein